MIAKKNIKHNKSTHIFHLFAYNTNVKIKKEECVMKSGCGCNNGVGGAAFALVLFILLVIILGAFI